MGLCFLSKKLPSHSLFPKMAIWAPDCKAECVLCWWLWGGEPLVQGWPCGSSPASTEMLPLTLWAHQAVVLAEKQLVAGLGGHMQPWTLPVASGVWLSSFLGSLASYLFPQLVCSTAPVQPCVLRLWAHKARLKTATQTSPSSPAVLGIWAVSGKSSTIPVLQDTHVLPSGASRGQQTLPSEPLFLSVPSATWKASLPSLPSLRWEQHPH